LGVLIPTSASEPFRYPEAKHGKAELNYHNGIPVLVLQGAPEEMGEQTARLARPAVEPLLKYFHQARANQKLDVVWPLLVQTCKGMVRQIPPDHHRELEALARVGKELRLEKEFGLEYEMLLVGHIMFDMSKIGGCSTLVVESGRSTTGKPLFGRNWDFPSLGILQHYGLVVVFRPEGKRAFASVGFPGVVGAFSAMNDAGLCLAINEVYASKDEAPKFDVLGVPRPFYCRRIMEECATIEEAEKLVRSMRATTMFNMTLCDRKGSAVLEITPKSVVVRRGESGLCCCTNHFCTAELATPRQCWRLPILDGSRKLEKLGVAEVARKLHEVNQGQYTIQSMIFEPADLRLHLAMGELPSSAMPMKTVELAGLLKK